jgi:hypothetical protein
MCTDSQPFTATQLYDAWNFSVRLALSVAAHWIQASKRTRLKYHQWNNLHVVLKQRRRQITKTNRKKNLAVDAGQGAVMQNDPFMAEVMRRYKAGELSDEAFMAIAKSKWKTFWSQSLSNSVFQYSCTSSAVFSKSIFVLPSSIATTPRP